MALVVAAQIYPLEKANGWKKNPVGKLVIACASSLGLLFIPAIGNSPAALVFVILGFFGIGIGLLLNIYINIKLYMKTAGEIKRRALYAATAFILFTLGILWSVELSFGDAIHPALTNRWDVVIGSVIQVIAAIFYLKGFGSFEIAEGGKKSTNRQEKYSFIENLKGNFTRYDILDWLIIGGILGFCLLALAWMVYPEENAYSIMKDTISFLGSMDEDNNPQGWWLFSISFVIFGLMLIPVALYRHKRMKLAGNGKFIKIIEGMSFLFYIVAAIGVILIAMFPDNQGEDFYADFTTGKIHNKIALVAFGGFGLALLLEFVVLMVDSFTTKHFKVKYWLPVYIIFLTVAGLTAYTQIKWEMICESNCWPGDGIYSFPLWEWIVFFTLFMVLYTIALSIPNNLEKLKKKEEIQQ